MNRDELYMRRCLELASQAKQTARPNPMVGAVIVHKDVIIGEGYHQKAGLPHAEVNAIASVKNKELLKESTIYVSLEPCSHYGKTPPCAELLIKVGIPKVVVGTLDPFHKVSGRGINMLEQAGIEVKVGVLEQECRELNRFFFHFQEKRRPYVILKWAESADNFIDGIRNSNDKQSIKLSCKESQLTVHQLRSQVQAILVGTETALKDNPSLTVRLWHGENPLRIVIDRSGRLPSELTLFDGKVKTVVFCNHKAKPTYEALDLVEVVRIEFGTNAWDSILEELASRSIQSLLVEGGAKTLQSIIDSRSWQEARVEISPMILGEGIQAPHLNDRRKVFNNKHIKDSLIITYRSF
ncbi:MAG: bifunctional diaminohydroxyphosphoribosylaminopyrimidine deaminase/5-amino-6-(5-phosphoribosylamino)uracil reductase RibD [Bacteroidales bacterium]